MIYLTYSSGVLPRELVIGVVIGAIVTILLILVLVYIGFNLPWYQRHKTTSEKRDGFDDSDNVALGNGVKMYYHTVDSGC